jgi:hypothetical protein
MFLKSWRKHRIYWEGSEEYTYILRVNLFDATYYHRSKFSRDLLQGIKLRTLNFTGWDFQFVFDYSEDEDNNQEK